MMIINNSNFTSLTRAYNVLVYDNDVKIKKLSRIHLIINKDFIPRGPTEYFQFICS